MPVELGKTPNLSGRSSGRCSWIRRTPLTQSGTEPVSREDNSRTPPAVFVVIVPVDDVCFTTSHRLNHFDDGITCADCETVAAQAVVDGKDVDEAIRAFRAWSLAQGAEPS
jgi:hypothetical protein